jgi:GNAT superfamily N-acetyltransferase
VISLECRVAGDNPSGTRLGRFGLVTAAATVSRPELDFLNRIYGLPLAGEADVDDVLSFYRSLGLRPWVELPPGTEALAGRLADEGARPTDTLAVLYVLTATAIPSTSVEVRRVEPDDALRYADLLLEGHGVPPEERALNAPALASRAQKDDATFYVATVDGRDAAVGVLGVRDRVGYLANASTVEAFRRRGCQTALVARRIDDAATAGCELVTALTTFGSASQRTLERAGLRIAYTKTVWRL